MRQIFLPYYNALLALSRHLYSVRSSRATPPVAKAIDYMLKRWDGFARFLSLLCS